MVISRGFFGRMIRIGECYGERIEKYRGRILKSHAVLLEIRRRFPRVPLKRHVLQV